MNASHKATSEPGRVLATLRGRRERRGGPPARPSGRAPWLGPGLLLLLGGLLASLLCLAPAARAADSCPNAQYRTGYGAYLPECRAYEKVTPADKGEQDAPLVNQSGAIYDPQVSASGERAAYFSQGAFAGSPAANSFYLSTRAADDWPTVGVVPKLSVMTGVACIQGAIAYADDLSRVLLVLGGGQGFFGCGTDDPPLVPGRPEGVANLYVRDSDTGAYQLVSLNPVAGKPGNAEFVGGSPDLQQVLFTENAQLTADAVSGKMLYVWSDGAVRLVGQVPAASATSCTGAACVAVAGAGLGGPKEGAANGVYRIAHAVSDGGSRIFFHAKPAGGVDSLYLRSGETTTQVDASQGAGASGGGHFMTATADGSSVYFTAESKLTADSTATPGNPDLYRYDVATGNLTDLTVDPDPADVNGADVQGVVGAGEDGSYLYFVANGVLAGNANSHGDTAIPGDCTDNAGECNLYLRHGATTTFIATLAATEHMVWGVNRQVGYPYGNPWTSRVTPDGRHLAFNSSRSLTGYDSTPVDPAACGGSGEPCSEVFTYDAESARLACVSCNPTGAPPLGPSRIDGAKVHAVFFQGPPTDNLSLPRNLSDDGTHVFFDSGDALVPGDTNARQDVYEYAGGQVHLISTGRDIDDSTFFDASADGSSVYFTTRERLVAPDTDALIDLYDARVGGGLASQNLPPASPPCQGEACKGQPATAPAASAPGSAGFTGPGNGRGEASPAGAPVFKVANLSRSQQRRLAVGKRVALRVRVSGPGKVQVRVRGRLGRHGRVRTLAAGKRRARAAGTVKVGLRLAGAARRYLARHHRLRVAVRVSYSGAARAHVTRLTLRRATSGAGAQSHRKGGRR